MTLTRRASDLYAQHCDIKRDGLWDFGKRTAEVGELNSAYLSSTGRGRARGPEADALQTAAGNEVADVLAMVLLFADHHGIDVADVEARKWGRYLPKDETK